MDDQKSVIEVIFREGLAQIPGGSVLLTTAELVLLKRDAMRAQEFFRRLAPMLGEDSPEEAAAYISANLEDPATLEGVDRGYRQMMEAVDPDARQCIAALVAEYVRRGQEPDLAARHVGNLVADCDGVTLRRVRALLSVYPWSSDDQRLRILCKGAKLEDRGLVWFHVGPPLKDGQARSAQAVQLGFDISDLITLFVQHRIGMPWIGLGSNFGGSEEMEISAAKDSTLRLLRDCILAGRGEENGSGASGG